MIKYVPDQCKTKEMCDKVIIGNGRMLGSVLRTALRIKKMRVKSVDNYSHGLRSYVPIAVRLRRCVIKLPVVILLQ